MRTFIIGAILVNAILALGGLVAWRCEAELAIKIGVSALFIVLLGGTLLALVGLVWEWWG